MAEEWVSGESGQQLLENNPGVDDTMVESLKRKLEEERTREEEVEERQEDRENEEPTKKKMMVEQVIFIKVFFLIQSIKL